MKLTTAFILGCALIMSANSWAQVPNQMHYQGYLTNGAGEAIDCPDALQCAEQFEMRFRLYDQENGGVVLWEEVHTDVPIYQGVFHINLGQAIPITGTLLADATWLGLTVNSHPEMDPRQQLLSAAYALRAETAEESILAANAQELGGVNASLYALQSGVFSGNYEDLSNLPSLFSGSYIDLSDKPVLFSGNYIDLSDIPVLFSGSYTDLSDIPALFSGSYTDLSDIPALFSGNYGDLSNLPILFSGSYTDLTGRPSGLDDGDNDTLAGLSCETDEVARWSGTGWVCSEAGSSTATVPTAEPGPCTPESAGSMYYDIDSNELRICDGTEYKSLTVCSSVCPTIAEVQCGLAIVNGCGASCDGTGVALNLGQCATAGSIACGQAINDVCGNNCGFTGTSLNTDQCNDTATTCGTPVFDTCGNSCGSTGTLCPVGAFCILGVCGNNPWFDATVSWNASGKTFGRYTWSQADVSNNGRPNGQTFCAGKGGTLARPNSQAEWDGILNNIPHDNDGWWIDGHNYFACGTATVGAPYPYQYGQIFVPTGTSQVYTGCNCNASEQGLVVYVSSGGGGFDGCQNMTGSGNLGVMDEDVNYNSTGIRGFICEH